MLVVRSNILVAALLVFLCDCAYGQSLKECKEGIFMSGFLSRAQSQCGFSQFNEHIVEYIRICMRRYGLSENTLETLIARGGNEFSKRRRSVGLKEMCEAVLDEYGDFVSP